MAEGFESEFLESNINENDGDESRNEVSSDDTDAPPPITDSQIGLSVKRLQQTDNLLSIDDGSSLFDPLLNLNTDFQQYLKHVTTRGGRSVQKQSNTEW